MEKQLKVLVLGASGMAGHVISIVLGNIGHDVTAFSRNPVGFCKNINGDARNLASLTEIITEGKFDYIINAIGILNTKADENKADAIFLNSYLPHYLSEINRKKNTKLIHLSTDCVFSGKEGGYSEKALRDGTTFYDRSKAMGEVENDRDLTFRNSIIGPDMREEGIGLLNWFMKQKGSVEGYANVFWSGVTTITLAKAIDSAMAKGLTGIYHLTNNTKISKYNLLCLFNKELKSNQIKITVNENIQSDKSIINTRTDFAYIVPTYEVMISELKDWIRTYKKLYPHYNI